MPEHDEFLNSVQVYTGTESLSGPKDLIASGATMLQTKTDYHTAVAVQKPRDLDKVVSSVMNEAKYAGSEWYYSWVVKSKDGPKQVEGGAIGLASSLVREWGNCVVDVEYEQQGNLDVFTARFVDLEKGVTFTRIMKQKRTVAVGRYDADRWEDMEFQKAQSKALRNVILAAMPKWLQKAAIEEAKKGVISSIERVGISKSRQLAVDFLAGYGVPQDSIESFLKKKKDLWTSEDVAKLRGIASQLKDGHIAPEEIFGKSEAPKESQLKIAESHVKRGRPPKEKPQEMPPQPTESSKATIQCPREGDRVFVEWCKEQCPDQCQDYLDTLTEPVT